MFEPELKQLLANDPTRTKALEVVHQLQLPDYYIAAGFVRNLVWDHLHQKQKPTALNDVDVIYFYSNELHSNQYLEYEDKLKRLMPALNWQVRNQATIHIRNNDQVYKSSLDAMSHWPEKETAVGVRLDKNGNLECVSAFGFESLFLGHITFNPKRDLACFEERVERKKWCHIWQNLKVVKEC